MSPIPRDHPIAHAILAEEPGAVRVVASTPDKAIGPMKLLFTDDIDGHVDRRKFKPAAYDAVALSWTAADPGPWELVDYLPTPAGARCLWSLTIEEGS